MHLVTRYEGDIPLEQIPWYEDVRRVARLLRWLLLSDERPASIPDFIESAETWHVQYDDMCLWEGQQQ